MQAGPFSEFGEGRVGVVRFLEPVMESANSSLSFCPEIEELVRFFESFPLPLLLLRGLALGVDIGVLPEIASPFL